MWCILHYVIHRNEQLLTDASIIMERRGKWVGTCKEEEGDEGKGAQEVGKTKVNE